jgi:hypothetical protein
LAVFGISRTHWKPGNGRKISTLGNDATADFALVGIIGDAVDIQAVSGITAIGEERYGRLGVERGKT